MIKVRLKATFFCMTDTTQINPLQRTSGKRFKAGIHYFPDWMEEHLPKSTEIIARGAKVIDPETGEPMDENQAEAATLIRKLDVDPHDEEDDDGGDPIPVDPAVADANRLEEMANAKPKPAKKKAVIRRRKV